MNIQKRITRQRVNHIVESYQLDGNDGDAFSDYLNKILEIYPQPLVELALTEAIIKGWSELPMQKGIPFLQGVNKRLQSWQPDRELSSQLPSSFDVQSSNTVGATSLDVRTVNHDLIDPTSIGIPFTPEQFEQITGLDASLVFDEDGKVLATQPPGAIRPLEQR
ncbi:MAG: hypothetical protein AAGF93_03585 [Cyanobacteria bacterium P01_H01_bin.105]